MELISNKNEFMAAIANPVYRLIEAVQSPMFFIALKWRLHITFVMR